MTFEEKIQKLYDNQRSVCLEYLLFLNRVKLFSKNKNLDDNNIPPEFNHVLTMKDDLSKIFSNVKFNWDVMPLPAYIDFEYDKAFVAETIPLKTRYSFTNLDIEKFVNEIIDELNEMFDTPDVKKVHIYQVFPTDTKFHIVNTTKKFNVYAQYIGNFDDVSLSMRCYAFRHEHLST